MMINTPREDRNSPTKERNTGDHGKINTKASSSTSTSWLKLKDPRIVRVSRAFGGKDRHSKVCTIRGLRDRRVRLSVPTAIQLYDLQERLGLNQPSKVVDWLLNEAKHEIDELPPLPLPPMNIGLNHQPMLMSSSTEVGASRSNGRINWEDQGGLARPNFWSNDAFLRAKSKEATKDSVIEKGNWTKRNENNKQEGSEEGISNNLFPRATHSSSSAPGLMNNPMPYGSFFQLEHPNFPFSQVGSYGFSNQTEDLYNLNAAPSPSPLSLSSGSQILVAPQPYFPSHVSATSTEIDPRQVNHFQMLASSTQNLFPNSLSPGPYSINQSTGLLHFSLAPSLFHSLNSGNHQSNNKEQ